MHICQQEGFEPVITKQAHSPGTTEPNYFIHVYDLINAFNLT